MVCELTQSSYGCIWERDEARGDVFARCVTGTIRTEKKMGGTGGGVKTGISGGDGGVKTGGGVGVVGGEFKKSSMGIVRKVMESGEVFL